MDDKTRNYIWTLSLIGLIGVAGLTLAAGGAWLYRHQTQAIRSEKQLELKAIAELKADQIVRWRAERVGDARVNSGRDFLRSAVGRWLNASGDALLRTEVEKDMQLVRTSYGYENVIVADTEGRILLSLNPRLTVLDANAKQVVARSIASRDVVFGDFFRCPTCNQVHLDLAAPILGPEGRPVAALVLRCDPEQFLYPLVQSWPMPSRTAETLLVRKDGDDALFLNKLRHAPDPALTLRLPLSQSDCPAVRAAFGQTGEIEGRDYRGVNVLAEILPVPNSPWFMVAKVDADEILTEARYRGRVILIFTVLCMFMTGALAAFVFMYRQKTLYRNLLLVEQQRRAVEEEIRATFYSIGDGVISTDAGGQVTRMNPVAEQLTGWSEAESLGKPVTHVFRIVNEESRAEVENPVARVMREGIVMNLANHTLLMARDGSERPIADSGAPIRDEKGHVTGAVLIFRDQTEERRAEEALRESEEWYRTLFVEATDGICLVDASTGLIIDCNQALTALVGRDKAELIGRSQKVLHPPVDDNEPLSPTFRQHLGDAAGQVLDTQVVRKSGEIREVAIRARTLNLAGTKVMQGLFRDITVQKQIEESLREALSVSERRQAETKNLLSAARAVLTNQDFKSMVRRIFDLCKSHVGATVGYVALLADSGRENEVVFLDPGGLSCTVEPSLSVPTRGLKGVAYRTGRPAFENDLANSQWAQYMPEGHVRLTNAMFSPLVLEGRVVGLIGLANKATPFTQEDAVIAGAFGEIAAIALLNSRNLDSLEKVRKNLEDHASALESANRRLVESTQAAQAATRAKSEFLANMSHEIRTPMTSILGFTDLLMDDSLSATDRKNFLTTVRRNGQHLLQVINDILDLSKIEAGKMVMELGPCNLRSVVADVASMMRPRAEQRANTLEVRYTGPLPETIQTDGSRIRQVLVNLVGNAVKFTENGRIGIGVTFLPHWRSNQSAVSVEVTDTGIGIRQESLPRLFEPFAQADNSTTRRYGGTGLGLAISRQIVTALGGEITVGSVLGEGSTFTVTIPAGDISGANLLQSPGEAISDDEVATRWTPAAGALLGVKILLAEDSIDNQELLRAVLGSVGAEVEVVENGRLAIERAETGAFDVVLMDMNMPEVDGYDATRRLRDRGYTHPILALTANAMWGDAERCLSAGCNAHLAKPIDRKRLIETLLQYADFNTSQTEAPAASPKAVGASARSYGIPSQFAHDPAIADILPVFVERLPSRLDELCRALEEENLEDVQRLAHRLKGAGGSYGYPTLSEMAKSLETAAKAQNRDDATASLLGIKEVCAAIQAGWTGHAAEVSRS